MGWFSVISGIVQLLLAILDRIDKKEHDNEIRQAYLDGISDTNAKHDLDRMLQRYRARKAGWDGFSKQGKVD